MPAQQEQWIATAYIETGTIARGEVACLNEAGTRYIVASAANRTAAGRRSACIALSSADADSAGGSGFEAQYVGCVPPSISGLGDGDASLIRVSSAGVLERVGSYLASDDVCGRCDEDGTAYVCFPLVGLGVVIGSGSAPGLPANSVQYYLTSTSLGGAARVSIDPVAGNLQLGASAGPFASAGTIRKAAGVSDRWRSIDDTRDVTGFLHTSSGGFGGNVASGRNNVRFGDGNEVSHVDALNCFSKYGFEFTTVQGAIKSSLIVFAPNLWSTAHNGMGVGAMPNFYLGSGDSVLPMASDIFGGNSLLFCLEGRDDAPTGNPSGRLGWIWYHRLTGKVWVRTSGGTDTELTNVAGGSGDETESLTITASPSGALDMATYGHLDVAAVSGDVTIGAFVAPAAGKAKRFTIHSNAGGEGAVVTLTHEDSGETAANRIYLAAGVDLDLLAPDTYLVTYSHSRQRWLVTLGVA